MRKYLRAIARANMERAGIQQINKRRYAVNPRTGMLEKMPSFFANNWRSYLKTNMETPARARGGNKR